MKKVVSAVLTAAMVVGMGVSVLAATPSKTVADEVKATGEAKVTGIAGIIGDVEISAVQDTAQAEEVLKDVVANVDLKEAVGASEETKAAVDVTAAQTFNVETSNLANFATVELTIESKVVEAAYAENEEVTVLVAVPTVAADGTVTYTYHTVTGKFVDGKVVLNLSGRQIKSYGSNFTLLALKTIED